MKKQTVTFIDMFFERETQLQPVREYYIAAVEAIVCAYRLGAKILVCGNGGSAADSEHIVGELMKGFRLRRPVPDAFSSLLKEKAGDAVGTYVSEHLQQAIPAIALTDHSALATAFANDVCADTVFAQQVYGYGKAGDILIALSTSGNSCNVLYAALTARALGMTVIALTGQADSRLSAVSDITLRSAETETYRVQEDHIKLYHLCCAAVEMELFEE